MTDYKYIMLDLDGTIIDSQEGVTKAVSNALQHFGIEVKNPDDLRRHIGPPTRDAFRDFYGFDEKQVTIAVEKFREYYSVKGIFQNKVYEGLEEMFKKLKQMGKKLIVATCKPQVYAVKILEHENLLKYFDYVAGSEIDGTRSTKTEVINYALKQCGITDLSSAIMIGDREHDVHGAKASGVSVIGILYGFGSREELKEAGADYIIETVADLERFLTGGK